MTDRGPILDYASPRPRGRLRLPANSEIAVNFDPTGVTIVETLKGRSGAIAALLFGAMMLVVSCINVRHTWKFLKHNDSPAEWGAFLFAALVLVSLAVVMVLVIDQTWRRTVLRADREGLRLDFRALFRSKQYCWTSQYVGEIRVIATQDVRDAAPLGELEIHLVDQPLLKLFTDHLRPRLEAIADVLRGALGLTGAPIPPAATAPMPPSVQPDPRTFDRLMHVHRDLRSSR